MLTTLTSLLVGHQICEDKEDGWCWLEKSDNSYAVKTAYPRITETGAT